MRDATPEFLAAIQDSHTAIVRVDALYNGVTTRHNLPISGGSVTFDRTSDVRSRCSITFVDPDLIPQSPQATLSPYGQEIQVWRGIRLSNGDELIPLGIFQIESGSVSDPSPSIPIQGFDRSQGLKEADFWYTYVVPAGITYEQAIKDMVREVYPNQEFRFQGYDQMVPTPLVYQEGENGGRWKAIQEITTALGAEIFFDGHGAMVLQPEPDPSGTPRFLLSDGEGGVAVETGRSWSRSDIYNGVVAVSSNPATPDVRAFVTDDDPTSDTQWGGPFGRKVRRWASPLLADNDMATKSAASILQRVKGAAQQVKVKTWPNPAMEPGDLITIRREDLALNTTCIVDVQDIGLTEEDSMSLQARSQQTTFVPSPPPPLPFDPPVVVDPPPIIVVGPTLLLRDDFRNAATSKFVARTSTGVNTGLWPVTNNSIHKYRPAQVAWDASLGLRITALWDGTQWWSGLVDTRYVWDFPMAGNGIKVRFRWTCSTYGGLWPTGWALPQPFANTKTNVYGVWPTQGEWDWMEAGKGSSRITGTVHFDNPFQSGIHDQRPRGSATFSSISLGVDYTTQYRITEAEWIPNQGWNWYDNGVKWLSVPISDMPHAPKPFDQPFYPIFNMAVGGQYPGNPVTPATGSTYEYNVDYVEIYQL